MKRVFSLFTAIAFTSALMLSQPVLATMDSNTEKQLITNAMKLYAEASSLEPGNAKKSELLKQSEGILTNVIKQNPKSLDAHRKLMGVYLMQQDYMNGIRTMQNAITLSPEDPKLFVALAILYEHSGAYDHAKAMLDQALELDPNMQLAKDYKSTIELKVEMQNAAMGEHHDDQAKKNH